MLGNNDSSCEREDAPNENEQCSQLDVEMWGVPPVLNVFVGKSEFFL